MKPFTKESWNAFKEYADEKSRKSIKELGWENANTCPHDFENYMDFCFKEETNPLDERRKVAIDKGTPLEDSANE